MHDPTKAVVVVDRQVQSTSVVPKGDRARSPAEAAGELGLHLVAEQKFQQWRAFFDRHVLKADAMGKIDEQAASSRFRMGSHHRLDSLKYFARARLVIILGWLPPGEGNSGLGRTVDHPERIEGSLPTSAGSIAMASFVT